MPSSLSWHPVWALPYFSPSCQGTTGSLANLDPSIDVAFVLPGVATVEEGLGPALFPGNPGLREAAEKPQAGKQNLPSSLSYPRTGAGATSSRGALTWLAATSALCFRVPTGPGKSANSA